MSKSFRTLKVSDFKSFRSGTIVVENANGFDVAVTQLGKHYFLFGRLNGEVGVLEFASFKLLIKYLSSSNDA